MTSMVSLFFNLLVNFIYSGVFIVNFENISHLAQGKKILKYVLYTPKKERKFSLTDCKLKCFFSQI